MEQIKHAIERSKESTVVPVRMGAGSDRQPFGEELDDQIRQVYLNRPHLESMRIVSQDGLDPQAGSFDMLRAQVLQAMDRSNWQFLAVTSPTAGCGKSVTAINLALSIARQPERSVFLVDMDLQKPKIADYLGIKCPHGLLSILEGRLQLVNTVFRASVGSINLLVLPGEICKSGSSEWMASRAMAATLQTIKREFRSGVVIFDLPPMLVSDGVISILPHMDALLLVAGIGTSKPSEITECNKHLHSTTVLRVVATKVSEPGSSYY
jgi:protein-tyrosine kinase